MPLRPLCLLLLTAAAAVLPAHLRGRPQAPPPLKPEDYVIGTGEQHTVEDLVRTAFQHVGLDWKEYVVQDPRFMRPAEVETLLADPTLAKQELGWRPKVNFEQLVQMMVDADLARLRAR